MIVRLDTIVIAMMQRISFYVILAMEKGGLKT
jgi:hypothetical protein